MPSLLPHLSTPLNKPQWRIENFAVVEEKVYSEKFEIGTHIW
jgi:hypothetical protein